MAKDRDAKKEKKVKDVSDKPRVAKKRQPHPDVARAKDPLEREPETFDFEKNAPIKRKQFASDAFYFEYVARTYDWRAGKLRERAEASRTLGSGKEKQKRKRLMKLQDKLAELKAELEKDGVDVDALLASHKTDEVEEAA